MVAYYLFIIFIAAVFYYLLVLNRVLFFESRGFTFLFVLWILVACSLFPGIASIVSPFLALLATIALAVLGGYIIYIIVAYHKARKRIPLLLLPAGKNKAQLLLSVVSAEVEQVIAGESD